MRAAIRTDASFRLGTGHVARTLALAAALRSAGWDVTFLSRERPGDLCDAILAHGYPVIALPPGEDSTVLGTAYAAEIEQSRQAISDLPGLDLLVVDHYGIDADWETVMRPLARRMMVVDDLANRNHDCDILLDQNFAEEAETRYAGRVPPRARRLLGPAYALLREEFRKYAGALTRRTSTPPHVLVSFGGYDNGAHTRKALEALVQTRRPLSVDVFGSPEAPGADRVRDICDANGFRFYGLVPNVAEYMSAADFAIGAMGGSAWERCITGLPSIVLTVAENQVPGAAACDRAGAVRWLGDANDVDVPALAATVTEFLERENVLCEMSAAARALVAAERGFSTDRVVSEICEVCRA